MFVLLCFLSECEVESEQQDTEGRPMLQLSPPKVTVWNFFFLSELLDLTEDKRAEIQACLHGKHKNTGSIIYNILSKHILLYFI